ncbi:MAG: exosortase C-terminal domain/associated protein EpsI [Armatimonadota bacterium]
MSKIQFHAFIVIVLLCLTIAATHARKHNFVLTRPTLKDELVPLEFKDWYGKQSDFDEEMKKQLPSCTFMLRYYQHEDSESPIELAVVYGTNLGDFHQPEVCLEGQDWRSVYKSPITIREADGSSFVATKAVMENSFGMRQVFVFWFYSNGVTSTSLGLYKFKMLKDRIISGTTKPSAMIRLSRQVISDDDTAARDLKRFAEDIMPYLRQAFDQGANQPIAR